MKDEIEYIDVNNTDVLVSFFPQIKSLFAECFGKELNKELWEWAYLDNPCGTPVVSLAVFHGKVIGHYAVIPQMLTNNKNNLIGYLSMTTMVSADFRRFGLFQLLAERVYSKIDASNIPSVVYGFPNNNSIAGFRKRLGWIISDEYKVRQIHPNDWRCQCSLIQNAEIEGSFQLDMSEKQVKEWRCNKPNQTWDIHHGIGVKEIHNAYDLMYYSTVKDLFEFQPDKPVNIVSPFSNIENEDGRDILFPYRFGYRTFNMENEISFNVQMCMSDVF
ncbi:GNAT family N-acetyltransferase [Vibrio sp. J2-4]|uniref:GNAT family N-acetyltransferase n=1 Tax=Vibrio sp. J2-4 TaxID=1507977 RepID=UPI001F476C5C|nr:GNAT family N-acetyltransferase [Vibrio sp. J2-4]MCF7478244.1 GNAT family N-acetyltransferase [Vibrio sp. J2-4]